MPTQPPTQEMIDNWKAVWRQYCGLLAPNRKSGRELVDYLSARYSLRERDDPKAYEAVRQNVLKNKHLADKLPLDTKPDPKAFFVEDTGKGHELFARREAIWTGDKIFVGIDLASGWYLVEGSCLLWDELCAFQGVDETDLKNIYVVAQYISCLKRFSRSAAVPKVRETKRLPSLF